jgi:hypothetical protein
MTVLNFATMALAAVSVAFGPMLVWVLIWMAAPAG